MADRQKQKRQSRKQLLEKRKDGAFVAEYVKTNYPGIYKEAEGFLNELRTRYPGKRDYTKTKEFLIITTEYGSYKEFYNRKRTSHTNNSTTSSTASTSSTPSATTTPSASTTTTSVDMSLTIPLMPAPVVLENTPPLEVFSPEINQAIITEITNDPELHAIFSDFENMEDYEHDVSLNEFVGLTPLERELLNIH